KRPINITMLTNIVNIILARRSRSARSARKTPLLSLPNPVFSPSPRPKRLSVALVFPYRLAGPVEFEDMLVLMAGNQHPAVPQRGRRRDAGDGGFPNGLAIHVHFGDFVLVGLG